MHDKNPAKATPIDPEQFCYYPFFQLLLQPTGVVSPCCWNQGIVLGQVPNSTLEEIWNGESLRSLRREFLDGRPVSCAQQMRHIKCHKWSVRKSTQELELKEFISGGPQRLDVRLNGKCNLQCVMCDVWRQPNGLYDSSDFWTHGPEKIFPFLKEVDILGGEPFVQADTFRLIDAVAAVNPDCEWAIVTNGSYKFGPAIQRRLDKIKIRWIQVSLDSVNFHTYKQIRVGGDLSKTLATFYDYLNYRDERLKGDRSFHLVITMCVQRLNWREVGQFLEFGAREKTKVELQFAYDPGSASLLSLPEATRKDIIGYFSDIAATYGEAVMNPVLLPLLEVAK